MTQRKPSATGENGHNVPAPLKAEHEPAAPRSDDELRRLAAERLTDHLDMGVSLVGRCEDLAYSSKGDKLGALYAAARLMHANAQVAQALADVAQVERRRRSIVERLEPPEPKRNDWNARSQEDPDAVFDKLEKTILRTLEDRRRAAIEETYAVLHLESEDGRAAVEETPQSE